MQTIKIPLWPLRPDRPQLFATIDEADAELVLRYRWNAVPGGSLSATSFYANTGILSPEGSRRTMSMHRLILGLQPGDGKIVDHLNHDGLDNRRENLRIVSKIENHRNRHDRSKYGTGIYLTRPNSPKPFVVYCRKQRIGSFPDLESARKAWLQADSAFG